MSIASGRWSPERRELRQALFRDAVLEVSGPGRHRLGVALSTQAEWEFARLALLAEAPPDLAMAIELAVGQGFALTKAQCSACGLSPARVRSLLRNAQWSRPYVGTVSLLPERGMSADGSPDAFSAHGRIEGSVASTRSTACHAAGTSAAVGAAGACLRRRDCFASHDSAAQMHGLPLLPGPRRPWLSSAHNDGVRRPGLVVRSMGVHPLDVTTWFGAPVTTVARTVLDLARTGVKAGLVAADAALTDGLVTMAELRAGRARLRYRPGITSADRVLDVAAAGAESALESLARLCLVEGGLPAPELQVPIGPYRVDMLYRACRVIVEADGELKYATVDALRMEKRRQEALEQWGFAVVRVSWSDVRDRPDEVVARVRRKLVSQARLLGRG